jgi:hypothetical protein
MSAPVPILSYKHPLEFQIGDVLLRSWKIYSRHLLTFLVLASITEIPLLVLRLEYPDHAELGRSFARLVLEMMFLSFAEALVVYAAFQELRGRPVHAANSILQVASRLLPVSVAAILAAFMVVLGLLFCLIPGLIAMAVLAVVVPACVVERTGPIRSMSRSAELTHGHRWPILGVSAGWFVADLLIDWMIHRIVPGAEVPTQLLLGLFQLFSVSYWSVYGVTLYHDLRAVREGIGINEIASVFD